MMIYHRFIIHAAHNLSGTGLLPPQHACCREHGHTYRVFVYVGGKARDTWVMNYDDIAAAAAPIIQQLDHHNLNKIEGLSPSTSENLAIWIWDRLKPRLPGLVRVKVKETQDCGSVYEGEGAAV